MRFNVVYKYLINQSIFRISRINCINLIWFLFTIQYMINDPLIKSLTCFCSNNINTSAN